MKVSMLLFLLITLVSSWQLHAGTADVVQVDVKSMGNDLYQFDVTVAHHDEGWEHYVDKWEVIAPDGSVLGSRPLVQPHQNAEQFTRSLVGVRVPKGIGEVTLRAHDTVHGNAGKSVTVSLPH